MKSTATLTKGSFKNFNCGNSIVNHYAQKNLITIIKSNKGTRAEYVLDEHNKIIGFVTYSVTTILPETFGLTKPPIKEKEISVIRVRMLGVEETHKREGIGSMLMNGVFKKAQLAREIGIVGVTLSAAPEAINFYKELGFVAMDAANDNGIMPMFIDIDDLPA